MVFRKNDSDKPAFSADYAGVTRVTVCLITFGEIKAAGRKWNNEKPWIHTQQIVMTISQDVRGFVFHSVLFHGMIHSVWVSKSLRRNSFNFEMILRSFISKFSITFVSVNQEIIISLNNGIMGGME